MFSIQQLIRALRKLQSNGELAKSFQHVSAAALTMTPPSPPTQPPTELIMHVTSPNNQITNEKSPQQLQQQALENEIKTKNDKASSQLHVITQQTDCQTSQTTTTTTAKTQNENEIVDEKLCGISLSLNVNEYSAAVSPPVARPKKAPRTFINTSSAAPAPATQDFKIQSYLRRSQQIQKFYQQQLHHFHTQHTLYANNNKQTKFAMSSLAAEPLAMKTIDETPVTTTPTKLATTNGTDDANHRESSNKPNNNNSSSSPANANAASSASGRPCFNSGFAEIIQFMELIGNLKHTKRTGWVLRDVNDCESISGHMYRMSMMTFLLDGSEGLNQIRCMELALVHDLAESLVGDITPFCGVSKRDKRAMEFKAMEDICKLIEPRGKKIMELFEEYETGESAESRFVKDLDRLDMVMQAFEYEKRDNCLLKHQEFFDSTEGKFNHPFVKKLVNEIYEQRQVLAKAKGATPPPHVDVPNMEDNGLTTPSATTTNGHCAENEQNSPIPKTTS